MSSEMLGMAINSSSRLTNVSVLLSMNWSRTSRNLSILGSVRFHSDVVQNKHALVIDIAAYSRTKLGTNLYFTYELWLEEIKLAYTKYFKNLSDHVKRGAVKSPLACISIILLKFGHHPVAYISQLIQALHSEITHFFTDSLDHPCPFQ